MQDTRDEPLELHGHELVADRTRSGAVVRWRCRVCGRTAEDASTYLRFDCPQE